MTFETERLMLREMTAEDFDPLYGILSDALTMAHYPAPFSKEKVERWINWNIDNYAKYGFGLWAVTDRQTGEFLGDCGITMQNISGQTLPEIGYHIKRSRWKMGYASEAAARVMRYAFEDLRMPKLYSYMKYTNAASYNTALKNGMKFIEQYADPVNTFTRVYCITREEWEKRSLPGDRGC